MSNNGLTHPLSDTEKAQLRAPITEWLQRAQIEDSDNSLVEYAVILAATPRSQSELNNELSCFLENHTEAFIDWLFPLLAKIQAPPAAVSEPKPVPVPAPAQVAVAPVQAPVIISPAATTSTHTVTTAEPAQSPANVAKQSEISDDSAARAAARRERFGAVSATSTSTPAPIFSDSDISAWSKAANALPTRAQRQRALTLIDSIRSTGNADARSELVRFLAANAPAPVQPKPVIKPSEAPKSEPVAAVTKQSAPAKQVDNKPQPRVISTADLKSKTAEAPSKPAKAANQTQPAKSAKPADSLSKSAPSKTEVKITVTAPAADAAPTARRIKVSRVGDSELSKPVRSQRSRSPVCRQSRSRSPSRERRYRRSRSRSRSPSRSRSRGSYSRSRSRSYSRSPRPAPTNMPSMLQRPVVPVQMMPMQGGFQPVQPFMMPGRPMQPMMMNPALAMNPSNMHMNQASMNPGMNPGMAPQMNRQSMMPQYVPVPLHRVQMMMGQNMVQNNMMMPGFQSQMSRMPMPVQQTAPIARPQTAQPVQSMSSPHMPAPMVTPPVNPASSGPSHPTHPPAANRCSYWPLCSRGQSCHFQHPTAPCAAFPKCEHSESTCPYIHQALPCRFGPQCTRSNCNFVHDMQRLAALQSVWMSISHGSTMNQSQPPRQRLHINMNASNLK